MSRLLLIIPLRWPLSIIRVQATVIKPRIWPLMFGSVVQNMSQQTLNLKTKNPKLLTTASETFKFAPEIDLFASYKQTISNISLILTQNL